MSLKPKGEAQCGECQGLAFLKASLPKNKIFMVVYMQNKKNKLLSFAGKLKNFDDKDMIENIVNDKNFKELNLDEIEVLSEEDIAIYKEVLKRKKSNKKLLDGKDVLKQYGLSLDV